MQLKRRSALLVGALLLGVLFVFAGGAKAVPCGWGGVTPSGICADGPLGDANDSVDDINTLAFGGFPDWFEVTKTLDDDGADAAIWTGDFTGTTGDFTLYDGIWSDYETLAVVLKGGGSTANKDIKWSVYMLVNPELTYDWNYDGGEKDISHLTLYARDGEGDGEEDTPVPEPATMILFGTGLLGFAGAFRKHLR